MVKKIIMMIVLVLCLSSISFANRDYLVGVSLEYDSSNNSFSILDIKGSVGFRPENFGEDYSLFLYDSKNVLIDNINFSLPTSLYAPLIDLNTGEPISPPKQNTKEINLYFLYSPDITTLKIIDNSNGEVLLEKDISLQISQIEFTTIDNIMFDERVRDIGTAKKILASNYYDTRPLPTYESNMGIKNAKTIDDNNNKSNQENINNNSNNINIEKIQETNIEEETQFIENKSNTVELEKNNENNNTNKLENSSNEKNEINTKNSTQNIINVILIFLIIIIGLGIYFIKARKVKNNIQE